MGTILPARSTSVHLNYEPGLALRHPTLRDCMAAGVYQRGLTRVAGLIDESPSKLSEKLSGGNDRPRDVGLDQFERYIERTGDVTPIYYLADRFLRDPAQLQQEALAKLTALADVLPGLLAAARSPARLAHA